MPETGGTIFLSYPLRAAGTGGPVGAPIAAYRKGNRSEPALAGYQHFGGGSDEPLKPYRSYPADLTSGPQRQSSLSDSLGGVERVRAWPDHRHGFATSGPQRHWQSWGVVRALPSACSVLRYARSDPAAGSDKYIPSCKDRPFFRNGWSRAALCPWIPGDIWSRRPSSRRSPMVSTSVRALQSPALALTSRKSGLPCLQGGCTRTDVWSNKTEVSRPSRSPSIRYGTSPALPNASARWKPTCAASCSNRPRGCFPSW